MLGIIIEKMISSCWFHSIVFVSAKMTHPFQSIVLKTERVCKHLYITFLGVKATLVQLYSSFKQVIFIIGHFFNDNLTKFDQRTAGRTSRPTSPTTCKIQFWYIGSTEAPVLHSIAFSNANRCGAKKKDDEIRLIGSWDLGVLF